MGIEAMTILNRRYGIPLIQRGFNIIDIQPSHKSNGDVAFIFERTPELEQEFNIMVNENRFSKRLHGLNLYDIRTLIGMLSGFEVEEEDRFRLMGILNEIDNDICTYKVRSEENSEKLDEPSAENTDDIKKAMYDKAFNKAVK